MIGLSLVSGLLISVSILIKKVTTVKLNIWDIFIIKYIISIFVGIPFVIYGLKKRQLDLIEIMQISFTQENIFWLFAISTVFSLANTYLTLYLFKRYQVSKLNIILSISSILFTIVLSMICFGEKISSMKIIGIAMCIIGIYFIYK